MKIRLYLEICSACNLRCKYCFERDYVPCFVDTNSLLNFTDTIRETISDVVITGGEPSLHPDFYKIVEHFSEYTDVIVTTNGTAIDYKSVRGMLSRHSNIQVQFSLDAVNQEFVDFVRGKGVWEQIMTVFSELAEFRSQLCISSTLTFQSTQMLRDIYSFAKEHQIHCYFPALLPYGALSSNWTKFMPTEEEYIKLEETLFELIANDDLGIIHSNKLDILLGNIMESKGDNGEEKYVIKIDSMGNILVCPATDCSNERSNIANMNMIHSVNELNNLLEKHYICYSANVIADRCENCEVEVFCRRTFCGNCIHLVAPDIEKIKYICNTYKHHYSKIAEAISEGT